MFGKRSESLSANEPHEALRRHDIAPFLERNGVRILSTDEIDDAPGRFQIAVTTRDGESASEFEAMLTVEPLMKGHGHDDVSRVGVWIGFYGTEATTLDLANTFNREGHRSTAIITEAGIVLSRVTHHGFLSREAAEWVLLEDITGVASDALAFSKMHNAELKKLKDGRSAP